MIGLQGEHFFFSGSDAMSASPEHSLYPIRAILPYDRFNHVVNEIVVAFSQELSQSVQDRVDSVLRRTIAFRDKSGADALLTYEELANRFSFQYTPYLIFLHEKELRNSFLYSPGKIDTERDNGLAIAECQHFESQLSSGTINELISVRHVGLIDGIDVGFGVFAETDLMPGTFLGEYVGIVHATPSSNSSSDGEEYAHDRLEYTCQFPSCDNGLGINAIECGNIIRFVNHSVRPNAMLKSFCDSNGLMHVLCLVSDKVSKGEQIMIDYGASYWQNKRSGNVQL